MHQTKILITGVAGLIGSNLLNQLICNEQCEIIGVDNLVTGKRENIERHLKNKKFKFCEVDILNRQKMSQIAKGKIDVIFHEAAYKKISENEISVDLMDNNIIGTKNMLEIARKNKAKFIFASTSDVYGPSHNMPLRETDQLILGGGNIKRSSYAASKLAGEHLCFGYYKDYGIPIIILRYFGTFGAGASKTWKGGHIPLFIQKILNDEAITIHGDGSQTRSMCYITDITEGTIEAMKRKSAVGEIINLGGEEEISVLMSAKLIQKACSKLRKQKIDLKINYLPHKKIFGDYKEIMRRKPDLTKAKKILGFNPKISFMDGLELYIKNIEKKNE